jgi:transcriptional regulator with XRE-family HTH domain
VERAEHDEQWVRPDGLSIRRRRHLRKWSPREFVAAIARAHRIASGLIDTISPNLLQHIEEKNERIPYETLCMIARGLDCDPTDLLED